MAVKRTFYVFLVLVVGAVVAIALRLYLATPAQQAEAAPEVEQTLILVAARPLSTGAFLTADDVEWGPAPAETAVRNQIVEGTLRRSALAGSVVTDALAAGEPITRNKVIRPGDRGFLAAVLDPGKRAVTVWIDEATGNSGLTYPGDRVDLILTTGAERRNRLRTSDMQDLASETILKDVRVLAVGQRVEHTSRFVTEETPSRTIERTATLEVGPREAEIVSVAQRLGSLSLSLRSLTEPVGEVIRARHYTSAADVASALPPEKPKTAPTSVLVIRGPEREVMNTDTPLANDGNATRPSSQLDSIDNAGDSPLSLASGEAVDLDQSLDPIID